MLCATLSFFNKIEILKLNISWALFYVTALTQVSFTKPNTNAVFNVWSIQKLFAQKLKALELVISGIIIWTGKIQDESWVRITPVSFVVKRLLVEVEVTLNRYHVNKKYTAPNICHILCFMIYCVWTLWLTSCHKHRHMISYSRVKNRHKYESDLNEWMK